MYIEKQHICIYTYEYICDISLCTYDIYIYNFLSLSATCIYIYDWVSEILAGSSKIPGNWTPRSKRPEIELAVCCC